MSKEALSRRRDGGAVTHSPVRVLSRAAGFPAVSGPLAIPSRVRITDDAREIGAALASRHIPTPQVYGRTD